MLSLNRGGFFADLGRPISMLEFIILFLWLVPAYVLAGVASVIIATAKEPTPWRGKDFSDVEPWLAILLRRGYQGGHVLLTHGPSGRSLRFRKYIRAKGDYGLEFCIPNTDWATEYWPMIQAFCDETGRHYRVVTEAIGGSSNDVLLVDCEQEMDRAYDLALTIWTKFFDLSTCGWFEREGADISVRDELVDDPDHARLSEQEANEHEWNRARKDLRKHAGISCGGIFYVSGLLILGLITVVGLPLATLMSIGDRPSWSVDAGSLTVGGSTTSLVFFLLYLLILVALIRFLKQMKKPQYERTVYERLYAAGLLFVMIALPITVTLVWIRA